MIFLNLVYLVLLLEINLLQIVMLIFALKTKTPDMFVLVHVKYALQKLLSNSIDIVKIRDRMNPYLKNRIENEAIYV